MLLETIDVEKRFGGLVAVNNVSLRWKKEKLSVSSGQTVPERRHFSTASQDSMLRITVRFCFRKRDHRVCAGKAVSPRHLPYIPECAWIPEDDGAGECDGRLCVWRQEAEECKGEGAGITGVRAVPSSGRYGG